MKTNSLTGRALMQMCVGGGGGCRVKPLTNCLLTCGVKQQTGKPLNYYTSKNAEQK